MLNETEKQAHVRKVMAALGDLRTAHDALLNRAIEAERADQSLANARRLYHQREAEVLKVATQQGDEQVSWSISESSPPDLPGLGHPV